MAEADAQHWLLLRQVETTRALYEAECAKRETVRTSMAVPVAVLSFAAFGLGAVAANFEWSAGTPLATALSGAVAAVVALSVALLLVALWTLVRDATKAEADASVTLAEVHANAREIERILLGQPAEDSGDALADAERVRREAEAIALEQLSEEYAEHTWTLIGEVRDRLDRRRRVFAFAVPGFMGLVLALALTIPVGYAGLQADADAEQRGHAAVEQGQRVTLTARGYISVVPVADWWPLDRW